MADTPLTPLSLQQKREVAIARLCEHFARDHIGVEELEGLIDRTHQALTVADLRAILAELPPLEMAPAGEPSQPASDARAQQVIVALMGGAQRRGGWTPARRIYVIAVMGGVALDFRQARLQPGTTEIVVVAIMGGVEIIVPPHLPVESHGIGIMGGFDHAGRTSPSADWAGPVLRVSGAAIMGGVELRERALTQSGDSGSLEASTPRTSADRLGSTQTPRLRE